MVPCLFSAVLLLFYGSKVANTVLHIYTPQAGILKIKTRRNLKYLHLGCKVHLIFSFMQVFHDKNIKDIYLIPFPHSNGFCTCSLDATVSSNPCGN